MVVFYRNVGLSFSGGLRTDGFVVESFSDRLRAVNHFSDRLRAFLQFHSQCFGDVGE